MKITFAESAKADIIAFLVDEDGDLPEAAAALNETTGGLLSEAMDGSRFSGKKDQQAFIVLPKGSDARRAVLIGAGKKDKRDARVLEGLGANLYKSHSSSGFKSLAVHAGSAEDAARIALGAKLASYRFDTYFTKLKDDQKPSLESVTLVVSDVPAAEAAFVPLNAGAEGTKLARDLVNMPPNDLYPASFAEKCRELGQYGVQVEVLGEAELAKLGMNSMLGVGQGSVKESQLGVMKWMGGAEGEDPVILIGKGVCFDTGGISLKPGPGMEDMRGDMGGAAAVTGAIRALAERKAKVNVIGLVGLVENMPDGDAIRPGDILKSASGQTIEVQNTDAEGRLVGSEADLLALVLLVGAVVDDTLGVVAIARPPTACAHILETAGKERSPWILNVDHVEAPAAGFTSLTRPHCVGEPGLLVDHDVVGAGDAVVVGSLLEGDRLRDVSELGQVEHLHTVIPRSVGDDEGVISPVSGKGVILVEPEETSS